jgi:hypothetical protein
VVADVFKVVVGDDPVEIAANFIPVCKGPVRKVCGKVAETALREADEIGEYVYRVHGGASAREGRSWTPADPAKMRDPRKELGLPNQNSGQYITRARVKNWAGVSGRRSLPYHGNPGGAPEYLIPNPLENLGEMETKPVLPHY